MLKTCLWKQFLLVFQCLSTIAENMLVEEIFIGIPIRLGRFLKKTETKNRQEKPVFNL
jgi:hypothetical protein